MEGNPLTGFGDAPIGGFHSIEEFDAWAARAERVHGLFYFAAQASFIATPVVAYCFTNAGGCAVLALGCLFVAAGSRWHSHVMQRHAAIRAACRQWQAWR